MDILKMQSCGRLIQDIDCLSGTALAEFCGKLDTLCFSSGKSGGGLTQTDIGKPYIIQGLDLSPDRRYILKKCQCFFHSHIQYIINALALILHFQSLTIVAFALADFAGHIYIRKKMHLDLDDSVTAAGLAPSALDIKTETAFLVALCLGICGGCKKITDLVKNSGICGRIGTGSSSDRGLVDIDHLIQLIDTQDVIMFPGNHSGTVQVSGKSLVQDFIDQRALTGAGNTCDTGHHSQRDIYVDMLQVVLCRTLYMKKSGWFLPHFRYRDLQPSA